MISKNKYSSESSTLSFFFNLTPLFALLLIVFLSVFKFIEVKNAIAEGSKKGPPPMAVTTSIVKAIPWNSIIRTVGSVEPIEGAVLSAEESGRVAKIFKDDGATVKVGEPIIEIDSELEKAELSASEAEHELLKRNYERQKKLYDANVISQEVFDTSELNYKSAAAQLNARKAKLNRRLIKAPFNGKLGVRRVNLGDYVNQGNELIPLYNTSEIYIRFSLSQNDLSKVKIGDKILVSISNNNTLSAKIIAIDPSISPNTKTAELKAKFDSSESIPLLGSFIHIEVHIDDSKELVVIPSTSIQYAPYGNTVYIVENKINEDGSTIKIGNPVFIKSIDRRGDLVAVTDGLKKGDEIVTSGTFKLFPNVELIINNEVKVPEELNPDTINR